MQLKGWKNFVFAFVLATNGAIQVCTKVDKAWAENYQESPSIQATAENVTSLASAQIATRRCQQLEQDGNNHQIPELGLTELAKINDQEDAKTRKRGDGASDPAENGSTWLGGRDFISEDEKTCSLVESPSLWRLDSQILSDATQPQPGLAQTNSESGNSQPTPTTQENADDLQKQNDPPPLESPPGNFPSPSPGQIEQILETPQSDYSQRLENLRQVLQKQTQSSPAPSNLELGLRVRPRTMPEPPPLEQQPPLPQEKPVVQFKPIGSLQARISYFYSSNIFSASVDPVQDSLIFYGLTLASAYLPLGSQTFISGSIDGNQIHYLDQSVYDYNQLRFNVSLYRQLSRRMYSEISWSNQLLFYANNGNNFKAGDRFLNENALRLSLGRRDPLGSRLFLDSFYELSVNFSDPENRSRIINSLWLSLSYYLQQPLQVGINYQFNFSDFTNRPDAREDQFHRLFGHLNYRVSKDSNLNLQGGVSFGDSSSPNINFDGWFFSLNYRLELGKF
ncbi:hypothetical protein NIES2100_55390 [Calothrix sp. NIES-2100]|uniref:hypothetical protein n=1 Tax=Calothrix sp. NIES-2100 TaxID=1954172 RepID=UPI000B5DE951|nr:hypothetical protein NIES2100_55390 [Calothrix sp. NIES-2100]